MARVKGGYTTRQRRKKVLKLAKGYYGAKHLLYKTANEQVMHSLKYAFNDRRDLKNNMRKLWIARINAAARMNDISYSRLMHGLKLANVTINRKMLSEIAIHDASGFSAIVETAKKALANPAPVKKEEVKAETKAEKPVVKKPAEPKAPAAEEKVDLSTLKVAELRELAKGKNVEGFSTMKKAELIAALS